MRRRTTSTLRICMGLPDHPCSERFRHLSPWVKRCPTCEREFNRRRNQARTQYAGTWPAYSRAKRQAQPWCSICGATTDLTTDHATDLVMCRKHNSQRRRNPSAETPGLHLRDPLQYHPELLVPPGPVHGPPLPTKALAVQLEREERHRRNKAIIDGYRAGASLAALGTEHGLSKGAVWSLLDAAGVERRPRGRPKTVGSLSRFSPQPSILRSQSPALSDSGA